MQESGARGSEFGIRLVGCKTRGKGLGVRAQSVEVGDVGCGFSVVFEGGDHSSQHID